MANVTLLHYNNYFNRTIKKLDTLADYIAADSGYNKTTGVNFVPGDGVSTSLVLGTTSLVMGFDYAVVTEIENNVEVIKSRWFILEENRTRDGQYEIGLRRDVIADNLTEVEDAVTYIEKGYIQPEDPMIFNNEGIQFNQIKQKETLLKDGTGCPWLIMYLAKNASQSATTIDYDPANQDYISLSASSLDNWEFSTYRYNNFLGPLINASFSTDYQSGEYFVYNFNGKATVTQNGGVSWGGASHQEFIHNWALRTTWHTNKEEMAKKMQTAYKNLGIDKFTTALQSLVNAHNSIATQQFLDFNNKVVKFTNGKFYRINIVNIGGVSENNVFLNGTSNDLWSLMSTAVLTSNAFTQGYTTPDGESFSYSYSCNAYRLYATELPSLTVTSKISSTRNKTKDALYDVVCLPYGEVNVGTTAGPGFSTLFTTLREISVAAMTSLTTAMTGSKVYDVQLLPYCPMQSVINNEGEIVIDSGEEGKQFDYIVDNSGESPQNIGIVLYATSANFTLDILCQMNSYRSERIVGFTDISIPGGSQSTLKRYENYVLATLDTPQEVIDLGPSWIDDNGHYNITALESTPGGTHYINGINVRFVNKVTGEVLEEYNICRLGMHLNTNSADNTFELYDKVSFSSSHVMRTITKGEYDNADYYIVWQLTSNAWGGRGVDQAWPYVCSIAVYDYLNSESIDIKIENECNTYKLVSPNYQGEFQFSVAKNKGVDFFNVDCSYKPYNPYIHVNPNFRELYGEDFNDSRGLVCNGDFSVGMIGDKFQEYELQNKNYQAIFNRQIQNMDVNNAIAREEAAWQIGAGTVQGTVSGAVAGGMVGGGYGAIAGAVVGGVSSLAGGIADYANLGKKQAEAKSFAVDMYNYSLQNIKALPYSLTRCSAMTFNNKLFPFVEKYSCTQEEKEAFIEKLRYDGMSVLRVGKIKDYIGNNLMVRGEIIRLPIVGDSHMADAIYEEIRKGVYL